MASMDFSTKREGPGISVFWMILGMGIGAAIILAVSLVLTEGSSTPTTGTTGSTTEAVGPAPEGVADTTGAGMLNDDGSDGALQSTAGTNIGADVQGSVARTDEAPAQGVTDTSPRVTDNPDPNLPAPAASE